MAGLKWSCASGKFLHLMINIFTFSTILFVNWPSYFRLKCQKWQYVMAWTKKHLERNLCISVISTILSTHATQRSFNVVSFRQVKQDWKAFQSSRLKRSKTASPMHPKRMNESPLHSQFVPNSSPICSLGGSKRLQFVLNASPMRPQELLKMSPIHHLYFPYAFPMLPRYISTRVPNLSQIRPQCTYF